VAKGYCFKRDSADSSPQENEKKLYSLALVYLFGVGGDFGFYGGVFGGEIGEK
jgi:hypothetical protein